MRNRDFDVCKNPIFVREMGVAATLVPKGLGGLETRPNNWLTAWTFCVLGSLLSQITVWKNWNVVDIYNKPKFGTKIIISQNQYNF